VFCQFLSILTFSKLSLRILFIVSGCTSCSCVFSVVYLVQCASFKVLPLQLFTVTGIATTIWRPPYDDSVKCGPQWYFKYRNSTLWIGRPEVLFAKVRFQVQILLSRVFLFPSVVMVPWPYERVTRSGRFILPCLSDSVVNLQSGGVRDCLDCCLPRWKPIHGSDEDILCAVRVTVLLLNVPCPCNVWDEPDWRGAPAVLIVGAGFLRSPLT